MGDRANSGEQQIGQSSDKHAADHENGQPNFESPYADKNRESLDALIAQEKSNSTSAKLHDVHIRDTSAVTQVKEDLQALLPSDDRYNVSFYMSGGRLNFLAKGPTTELGEMLAANIGALPADSELWKHVEKMLQQDGNTNISVGKIDSKHSAPADQVQNTLPQDNQPQLQRNTNDQSEKRAESHTNNDRTRHSDDTAALIKNIAAAIPADTTIHFSQSGNKLRYQPDHNLSQMQWNTLGRAVQAALNQDPDLIQTLGRGTDVSRSGIVDHTTTVPTQVHQSRDDGYNPGSSRFELGADKSGRKDQTHLNADVTDHALDYPAPRMVGSIYDVNKEYFHGSKNVNIKGHIAPIHIGNSPNDIKIPVDASSADISASLRTGTTGDISRVSGVLGYNDQGRKAFLIQSAVINGVEYQSIRDGLEYYDSVVLKGPGER
jgi:hypothetical protein